MDKNKLIVEIHITDLPIFEDVMSLMTITLEDPRIPDEAKVQLKAGFDRIKEFRKKDGWYAREMANLIGGNIIKGWEKGLEES